MRRLLFLPALGMLALAATPSAQQGAALKAAADLLNVAQIQTLEYTGVGATFYVGQAYRPGEAWPIRPAKAMSVAIDYAMGAIRTSETTEYGMVMPLGGGRPYNGTQGGGAGGVARQATFGWNVLQPSAAAAPRGAGAGNGAAPLGGSPLGVDSAEGVLQIWLTPHGFVKGALANSATTRSTREGAEVSFTVGGKYKIVGLLNAQNLVERVRTTVDSSIVGELPIESVYSGYRDFGGFQFPSHIAQTQGGHPASDIWVMTATANPTIEFPAGRGGAPPGRGAAPANAAGPPQNVAEGGGGLAAAPMEAQMLAEGVYILSSRGSHNVFVIEMRDYVIACEANGEGQSLAVIAKLKEMFPAKPLRYIVNTHHHWDHSEGLRHFVAAGATIVTHQQNRAYFEKALAAPRPLDWSQRPQSKAPPTPRFHTVGDKGELTDGQRVVELHMITGIRHASGMLMVYLPKERLAFEADVWSPPAAADPYTPAMVPMMRGFYDTIRRLNLQVDAVVPNHNREAGIRRGKAHPLAELEKVLNTIGSN